MYFMDERFFIRARICPTPVLCVHLRVVFEVEMHPNSHIKSGCSQKGPFLSLYLNIDSKFNPPTVEVYENKTNVP